MSPRPPRQVPPPTREEGAQRTSSYSRFIPREELQGFAAWNPDSLQGASTAQRPPISAPASATSAAAAAAQAKQSAPAPAPEPEPSLQEQLHAARQAGYQDGYRDGLSALDAFKHSFAQQMTAQIGTLVRSFDADFRALEGEMAQALARSAVELARQVVRSEIKQRPEHIAKVAHDAVEALQLSARHVRVRVNPSDYPLVIEGAGEEMRAREAQVLPDADVPRGGCKVDSDISSVDASLATRWQQAVASMGQASLWEDRRSNAAEASAAASATVQGKDDQS
ncbi:flagellar biosynthesis protein [Paucibacter sp. B2R-40]|uniref:FliH/SctL family protein n=1 Tax=Paucibacter sp. B2R-40 TaxID=2893554 RepID=UPI0021E510D7|nr:FliH/SctL family protein [Paucibacter sp. B2R-40]MCV2355022.1 flagellar biosynthesis protein [Paucibacter sp. B2R-40]